MQRKHYSRAHWAQIVKRAKMVGFTFDPNWKCIIDGIDFNRCPDHTREDNEYILRLAEETS